jgi:hypothetical protein
MLARHSTLTIANFQYPISNPKQARLGGEPVGLPGYAWDTRLHNYVNLVTGRMVSRQSIVGLLTDVVDRAGETMSKLAAAAARGEITPRQFYELMQRETKHAYNAAAALGKGGWDRMTPADWGRNGRQLRDEYTRLRNFAADLAAGKLSEPQARARAALYADSAYRRYWELDQERQIQQGAKEEHWVTVGDERVCPICRELEARGWAALGSLPLPGMPHAGCRCAKEYR